MPHDKNGILLTVGERVLLEAEVTHLHSDENNCNMTMRTVHGMPPGGQLTYFTVNSKQCFKDPSPVEVAAKTEPSPVAAAAALLILALILLFGSSTQAQTTNVLDSTGSTLWDFVTTGSNYWVAPYTTLGLSSHTAGGGIAIGYQVSEMINPVVRLDEFDGQFWMPSLTAQLQAPRKLMGKIPVIPFGIAGIATPISGAGVGNGSLVTVLGAGAALKLDFLGSSKFLQHSDLVMDFEKWIGLPQKQQNQVRIGWLFKF